jgi:hypothetical protein
MGPEDPALIYSSTLQPSFDAVPGPMGDRDGADLSTFANQVDDHPTALRDLQVFNRKVHEFLPAQAGADEHCQDCAISFAL